MSFFNSDNESWKFVPYDLRKKLLIIKNVYTLTLRDLIVTGVIQNGPTFRKTYLKYHIDREAQFRICLFKSLHP